MIESLSAEDLKQRRARGTELLRELGEDAARVAVLSSFNVDLIRPFLAEALERAGVLADVRLGDFGQIAQQALNPASELYAGDPSSVFVVPAVEDMLAPLYAGAAHDSEAAERLVEDRLRELESSVSAVLERLPAATCYVVAFGADEAPAAHILDPAEASRGQRHVERFLDGVRSLGERSSRVVVVDWAWHVQAAGNAAFRDDRLWYLGRMRLNPGGVAALAALCGRHVAAVRGTARKVLALDLDDTLWGGIVGEAGVGGLAIGGEGVGLAFQDFQREVLKLRASGVLLVACSKNNRDDAVEVFEQHPGMVLRLEHLVADRINWQDKATSLREIAAELNLGLDSFVFLDDNPVERRWIAEALPQVTVPELPQDPAHRPRFVRELGLFDRVAVTEADVGRSKSYEQQRDRTKLQSSSASIEQFLRSLEQVVTLAPVQESTLPRAAQLSQRTNQFNLTTQRYTVADLEAMIAADDTELYTLALRDRFGDSGITGLAILRTGEEQAEIDTFLLSCRVLGRKVEDVLLAFLAQRARARGARRLVGRRLPTAKNAQTEPFYPSRGFAAVAEGVFQLELGRDELPFPEEIEVEVATYA